ncbi:uncharacterized protein EKO05_0003692 [Ascochyta rabiei]|uniref:Metal ion binding n=1 Tax=Didymella rabiei TaxID=5454 RepID=A0A162YXC1_DIDRA|nr:uncharacterized protein EKO05_0003692 [Ascochyta rabiei]KZM20284.1 metal ion binding [Ascochyta rabiei]UPX13166.1 hypothetical protein EKO05_0003692 [Ascochyta rabiei]
MLFNAPQEFGQPLLLEDYVNIQQPVTTSSLSLCAVCHITASSQRCSNCKNIHYCSSQCQTCDWPQHKLLCKQFVSSQDARPSLSHRRALYLPDKSSKLSFTWLQYGNNGYPLDRQKLFPDTPIAELKTIAFYSRFLPYWIQISYDSNPHGRSLNKNECAERLLNTTSGASKWSGPLVVLVYSAEEGLEKPALDVDTSVLGPLVNYLRLRSEYEGPVFVEQPQEQWEGTELLRILGEEGEQR